MNETPAPALQGGARERLPDPSWIGIVIGVLMCGLAFFFECHFQQSVMALPPGTAVRPMGLAVMEGGVALVGLLLGVPFSVLGIVMARSERRRIGLWLGVVGIVLSLLPFPIARRMSDQTVRTARLHIVP